MSWKEFEIQAPKVHRLHHDGRYALHSAVGGKEGEPPTATVPLWRVSMAPCGGIHRHGNAPHSGWSVHHGRRRGNSGV